MSTNGPNWQEIAYNRKRSRSVCMRAGTYEAVDIVSGEPWRDADGQPRRIEMDKGDVFPTAPKKGHGWQRIEDQEGDDES